MSTDPVSTYWALGHSAASSPQGTRDGLAFQIFKVTNGDEAIKKLSMPVDAFIPNVTCEIPKWTSVENAPEDENEQPLI